MSRNQQRKQPRKQQGKQPPKHLANAEFFKQIAEANHLIAQQNREYSQTCNIPELFASVITFNPERINKLPITENATCVIVEPIKTDICALKYINEMESQNVVILNFANRYRRGGGYLKGASAQEEDLMRVIPDLYDASSNVRYPFLPDTVTLTCNVTIMRDSENNYELLKSKERQNISVISAAAQNLKTEEFNEACVRNTLMNMYYAINDRLPEADTLILGAWGCGAFGNDPKVMATIMNEITLEYGGQFKYIVFAIPPGHNYDVFKSIITTTN